MKYFFAILVVVGLLLIEPVSGGTIWGYAYLQGQANHSGIQVQVVRYPLGVFCYDVTTDTSGYWSRTIVGGYYYHVRFFKPCYGVEMEDTVWIPLIGSVQVPDKHLTPVSCGTDWCDAYPYYPTGTTIDFPSDDGRHGLLTPFPVEWWYSNFHLTGQTSGKQYGAFVAFFKNAGMRTFAISDLTSDKYYSNATIGRFMTASSDNLDIVYEDQLLNNDLWWNTTQCGGSSLDPFLQRLNVDATADQDGQKIALDVYLQPTKAPMMVGGDGRVPIGTDSTYYYSFPRMKVIGVIEAHGVKEYVTGEAWFDHQWGDFLGSGKKVNWRWFSLQLDDGREIMTGGVWVKGKDLGSGSFTGGFNMYDQDCSLHILQDSVVATDWWLDPVSNSWFETQWHIVEDSRDVDLVVTAEFPDQVMRSVVSDIFPGAIFWEGACTVTGTIGGIPVSGKAYVEQTRPGAKMELGGYLACFRVNDTVWWPGISDNRLRSLFDTYLPASSLHSSMIVFTQCYGGDMMENFIDRQSTAVLSATSPGQTSEYGGYDDDAAEFLYPAIGWNSDSLHSRAVAGAYPFETPRKQGGAISLEPTSPSGPIKGRHIVFYAGVPDSLGATSDLDYIHTIEDNFADACRTYVYTVCAKGPIDGFDHWATASGLKSVLRDIRDSVTAEPDQQVILFVSDHGYRTLVLDYHPVCALGDCPSTGNVAFPAATWQQMMDDLDNEPSLTILSDLCYAQPLSVKYCGKTYDSLYFNCEDTIEYNENGTIINAWSATAEMNEADLWQDGDFFEISGPSGLHILEVSLSTGAIAKKSLGCTDCGDANSDGSVDISDAVFLISHIFSGGAAPAACNYAKGMGDANGDCTVDISDVVYLISRIFSGGAPPFCGTGCK